MNLTFEKAYNKYLEYANLKLKPTSILSLKRKIEKYALPYFGDLKIKKITTDIYIDWQKKIAKKDLSFEYKRNIHYCMCSIYKYLNLFYNIKNIPLIVGNFTNFNPIKKEYNIWSKEEFEIFIKSVREPIFHAIFNFIYKTGCRKSEAMALTFEDITKDYVIINKSISKDLINGKRVILTPKTASSNRIIMIDEQLSNELFELKKIYIEKYKNFNSNFFVFGGLVPISCTTLSRKKDYYCKKAGVKKIKMHEFRHSNATLLYNKNIPIITIKNRLGHSSIRTTADVYIHEIDKKEKKVLNILSSLKLD